MAEFFAELKRRQMYRVAAAYAVVAWLLLQLVNNLTPALNLPNWAATLVTVLLIVGFPIALLFCWIQHLAPADAAQSTTQTGRVDWVLIGGLAAVLLFMAYQQLAPTRQPGLDTAKEAAASQAGAISLAVLPFTNLSSDPEQEFFSDGMTEEITAALAKVPGLRVVGRTSAFQFKGENKDLRAIGQALSATHLIEGSVRKDGNEVRITAQLIRADDGTHLWTESYNRELRAVFALQEDIATAIAGALRVPLGLQPGGELVSNRGIDPESYQDYLRARVLLRSRGARVADAIKILEPLVMRSRDYAPAWALLSSAYYWAPQNFAAPSSEDTEKNRRTYLDYSRKAEEAAREAIRLDARQTIALGVMAGIRSRDGKWAEGDEFFKQALSVDPNDPETLHLYRHTLAVTGRLQEAMTTSERLLTLEPFVPVFNAITVVVALANGEADRALEIDREFPGLRGSSTYALAATGRFADAAKALAEIEPLSGLTPGMRAEFATAAELLRHAPQKPATPLPDFDAAQLVFVYAYIGAAERLIEFAEREFDQHTLDGAGEAYYLWGPIAAQVRKTQRFKTLMRSAGLLDYWRARGWPDLCRPQATDDFVCD